jgi:hypothetical protein
MLSLMIRSGSMLLSSFNLRAMKLRNSWLVVLNQSLLSSLMS